MNIILIILLTLFQEIPTLQDEIVLHEATNHLNIGRQTFVLEDKDGYYTIEAITKPFYQRRFIHSNQHILTFPPNNSFYWVKFNIRSATEKKFIIFIDEAKFKSIDLYYKVGTSTSWKVIKNGYSIPQDQKAIIHNFQAFPIDLLKGTTGEFYLRIQPRLLSLPISIESQTNFFQIKDSRYNLILGLVLGIIFFIGINNLGLFFSFGGPIRLLYFFTSFSFVLYSVLFNGHIFFASTFIYQNLLRFVIPLSFVGQFLVVLYGVKFLQVKKYSNWLYLSTLFFLSVLTILTITSLFTSEFYIVMCANIT
ncbi:MAG TPA: 7TM-DISM domain-containing protein, partial [Cyclobacteriaceae bacterium]|nr:7TM-DISM domain-containing protein [Cyclobacteriaceae bacterium]